MLAAHWAFALGHVDLGRWLITDGGADARALNARGQTPEACAPPEMPAEAPPGNGRYPIGSHCFQSDVDGCAASPLSTQQREALVAERQRTQENDAAYLKSRAGRRLRALVGAFTLSVMTEQPANVAEFAVEYFATEEVDHKERALARNEREASRQAR